MRPQAALCALASAALMGIYISSACPTIYLGDAGELAAAAYSLGIGHPPGYPLYTLTAKLFSFIPAGDIGFRMNSGVAFMAALTAVLFFLTARVITCGTPGAVAAALALALSPPFLRQAYEIKGGVYMLAYLALFSALLAAALFARSGDRRYYYLSLYLSGFLPMLHHAVAPASLFIVSWAMYTALKRPVPGRPAYGLLFFAFALATSGAYLFIRSYGGPEIRWAGVTGIKGVLLHMMRYPYIALDDPPLTISSVIFKSVFYLKSFFADYHLAAAASVAGFVLLFRENRRMFLALAGFFAAGTCIVILATGNDTYLYGFVNRGFYLVPDMSALLAASYALNRAARNRKTALAVPAAAAVAVALYIAGASRASAAVKFSGYDHPRNMLSMLDTGDILFAGDDRSVFALEYAKTVKGSGSGLRLYDRNANMLDRSFYSAFKPGEKLPAGKLEELELITCVRNPGKVYYADGRAFPSAGLRTYPYGLVFKIMPVKSPVKGFEQPLELCVNRDYFRNSEPDHFYAEQAGLYLAAKAEHAAVKRDMRRFDFYRKRAEEAGNGVPVVLRRIASVYFHEFLDVRNTLIYLERAYRLEPMNFVTLNLIISLYRETGHTAEALKWLNVYAKREWRKKNRNVIYGEINRLNALQNGGR